MQCAAETVGSVLNLMVRREEREGWKGWRRESARNEEPVKKVPRGREDGCLPERQKRKRGGGGQINGQELGRLEQKDGTAAPEREHFISGRVSLLTGVARGPH